MPDGVFSRLRDWLRSILGRRVEETVTTGTGDDTVSETAPTYKCDVCGTPVESSDEACPLCHSETIVAIDDDGSGGLNGGEDGEGGPGPVERRVAEGTSGEAAASLAALRDSGKDVLARHADKWEDRDSGGSRRYRVSLPDDGERFVGSREEVRSLLFRHYGTDDPDDDSTGAA